MTSVRASAPSRRLQRSQGFARESKVNSHAWLPTKRVVVRYRSNPTTCTIRMVASRRARGSLVEQGLMVSSPCDGFGVGQIGLAGTGGTEADRGAPGLERVLGTARRSSSTSTSKKGSSAAFGGPASRNENPRRRNWEDRMVRGRHRRTPSFPGSFTRVGQKVACVERQSLRHGAGRLPFLSRRNVQRVREMGSSSVASTRFTRRGLLARAKERCHERWLTAQTIPT